MCYILEHSVSFSDLKAPGSQREEKSGTDAPIRQEATRQQDCDNNYCTIRHVQIIFLLLVSKRGVNMVAYWLDVVVYPF